MRAKTIISILRNPNEFSLIIRIFLFLLKLPLLLKFRNITSLVQKITPRNHSEHNGSLTLERIIYLCDRCLHLLQKLMYKYSCLKRCLLLYHFLRLYRVPVEINFGIKWEGNRLTGHSWLTLNGDTFLEPPGKVEKFTRFFSLPETGYSSDDEVTLSAKEFSEMKNISFD